MELRESALVSQRFAVESQSEKLTVNMISILEELHECVANDGGGPLLRFCRHDCGVRKGTGSDDWDGGVRSSGVANNGGQRRPLPQRRIFPAGNLLKAGS